jgi:hypothetical protein
MPCKFLCRRPGRQPRDRRERSSSSPGPLSESSPRPPPPLCPHLGSSWWNGSARFGSSPKTPKSLSPEAQIGRCASLCIHLARGSPTRELNKAPSKEFIQTHAQGERSRTSQATGPFTSSGESALSRRREEGTKGLALLLPLRERGREPRRRGGEARLQGRSAISPDKAAEGAGSMDVALSGEAEGWIRSTLQATEPTATLLHPGEGWGHRGAVV